MNEETKQPAQQPQSGGPQQEHKKEKPHKLQERADKLQAEKDELFAKLQRLSADYMNYQKRSARLIAESIAYEKEVIIKSLLPVIDNFEHTLSSSEDIKDMENFRKGVKIVYDQMLAILKNHGVEQIASTGQKFDPACHQAVMQEISGEKEEGLILKELQKGYRIGDKILRPARVTVSKKPGDKAEPAEPPEETLADDEDFSDEDRE